MNTEQKYQVENAEAEVRQIRRTIAELEGFGWKCGETVKPLAGFDKYRAMLAANKAAIEGISPLDKNYKETIARLLSEENLHVESVAKLAVEARQALDDEELAFYDARDGALATLSEQIEEADEQIRNGLSWWIEGLQTRWGLMVKRQELAQRFQDISQAHNTPESFNAGSVGLPKPFAKMNHPVWGAFVASFLGRLSAVLPNMETATPSDAVKTIFEKPAPPIDIGHDPNSRHDEKSRRLT
jgi:hypothetical protein